MLQVQPLQSQPTLGATPPTLGVATATPQQISTVGTIDNQEPNTLTSNDLNSQIAQTLVKAQQQYPGQDDAILQAFIRDNQKTMPNTVKQIESLMSNARTARNNNPTALTTDVAQALGGVPGVDFTQGDPFKSSTGQTLYTAKLNGDPIQATVNLFDKAASKGISIFDTGSGTPRWSYAKDITNQQWEAMTPQQKQDTVAAMQSNESGSKPAYSATQILQSLIKDNTITPSNNSQSNNSNLSIGDKLNNAVVGFGTTMGNFGESLLNPFARVGVSAFNDIAAPVAAIGAAVNGGSPTQAFEQNLNASRNIGFTGGAIAPVLGIPTDNQDTIKKALDAAGVTTQIGSNFIGGNGVTSLGEDAIKQTLGASIYQGAKTGLQVGGLAGLGQGLQDQTSDNSVNDVLKKGLIQGGIGAGAGAVTGGVVGGVLGAVNLKANAAADNTWDMVQPKGKNVDPASIQYKNTGTGQIAVSVPTTDHDSELIEAATPYVKANDPITSWQNITNAAETKAQELRKALDPEQGIWSPDNYKGVLKSVPVPIGAKGEASASQVQGVQDYVMSLAQDAQKNTAGTLDVSRQFRQGINNVYGESIWDKDTQMANYIKSINRSLNDFTESKLPSGNLADGTSFKAVMKNISLLFEARDNISLPKVGTQTGTNVLGSTLKFAKPLVKPALEGAGLGAFTHLIP